MTLSEPGPRPELKWLDKNLFVVDHHYQRSTESRRSQEVIAKIATNFLWARFQPPTVMPGPKGKYIVIDGQHRISAAQKREDIKTVPVYIIAASSLADQARNFVAINQDRAALHPLTVHRALLAMGDPVAQKVKEVCEEADVTIARQPAMNGQTLPRETAAIGTIKLGLKKYSEAAVIAALMVLADAFVRARGQMRSATLKALMAFFHFRGVGKVDRQALIRVLKHCPPEQLEAEAAVKASRSGDSNHESILQIISDGYERVKSGRAFE